MSGHTLTVQETASYLRTLDDVLLLTHVRPDGDTVGSAAALCRALRDMGKTAYLLPNPEITATYEPYAAPYWAPEGFAPAHVVSVDIAALNLLPDNAAVYAPRIELAIDHHGSHGFFAARTCLDADAAACGEIVHDIIALLLYVAIATDTGCFVYSNTTARTHRIAAALLDTGIDAAPVNKALFRTKSRTRLAMEARMVADMTLFDHDRVVVMTIPLSLRQELHATPFWFSEGSIRPQPAPRSTAPWTRCAPPCSAPIRRSSDNLWQTVSSSSTSPPAGPAWTCAASCGAF